MNVLLGLAGSNLAVVLFHNALGDGKPQSIAALLPVARLIHPVKPLEQALQLLGRQLFGQGVAHAQDCLLLLLAPFQPHKDAALGRAVLAGVVQQDAQQLPQPSLIRLQRDALGDVALQLQPLLKGHRLEGQHAAPDKVAEVDKAVDHLLGGVGARQIEHLVHQLFHVHRFLLGVAHPALLLGDGLIRVGEQDAGVGQDDR